MAVRCQSVFGFKPFPHGFGVSPAEQARAHKNEAVEPLSTALREGVEVLEEIAGKSPDDKMYVFMPNEDYGKQGPARVLPDLIRTSDRRFPHEFYTRYLASSGVSREWVQVVYFQLSTSLRKFHLSDEALAVLALASRDLKRITERGAKAKSLLGDAEATSKVLQAYFLRLHNGNKLPPFVNFVGATKEIFLAYALSARQYALTKRARDNGGKTAVIDDEGQSRYLQKLTLALPSVRSQSLEERFYLAARLIEPELSDEAMLYLKAPFAPRDALKNNAKWNRYGIHFFGLLEQQYNALIYDRPDDSFAVTLKKLSDNLFGPESSGAKQFFEVTMNHVKDEWVKLVTVGPQQINERMLGELKGLGQQIKQAAKEEEIRIAEARKLELQAAVAQQPVVAPVLVKPAKKSASHSTAGKNMTRAMKRALRQQQEEAKKAESKDKASDGAKTESTKLSAGEVGPLLADVTFDTIVVGQRYAFKFNGARSDDDVQYVVFTKKFKDSFKAKRQKLRPWIKMFLMGRAPDTNSNGIKHLEGTRANDLLWEIKYLGSRFRVVLVQDKDSRTWTWDETLNHDDTETYIKNN